MEGGLDVLELVWGEAGLERCRVEQYSQILQLRGGASQLVLGQGDAERAAEGGEGGEALGALVS